MKKNLLYLWALVCSVSLLAACSSDDDNTVNDETTPPEEEKCGIISKEFYKGVIDKL